MTFDDFCELANDYVKDNKVGYLTTTNCVISFCHRALYKRFGAGYDMPQSNIGESDMHYCGRLLEYTYKVCYEV